MRIIALDIGDVWTGVAISDASGITVRPLTTYRSENLFEELTVLIKQEKVSKCIIGYPKTMRGTESEQTKKIVQTGNAIKERFSTVECIFLDERRTSIQAAQFFKKGCKTKNEKLKEHAIAAAILLQSYLDHLHFAIQEGQTEN
ncbi:Holliday junction resolvase RuvX [bacterium]|nr:MAG: Holliday junction resolvase RuvX [bacterium]QQR62075.1 MAG: Holliday junction resolvase RuvX [bacterium]QQR63370.1 MAG: Holliday junction resolvase RuvX [bacterium]